MSGIDGEVASDPHCPFCVFIARNLFSGTIWKDDLCIIVMCPDCGVPMIVYYWHGEPSTDQISKMLYLLRREGHDRIKTAGRITIERAWGHWRAHLREELKDDRAHG